MGLWIPVLANLLVQEQGPDRLKENRDCSQAEIVVEEEL